MTGFTCANGLHFEGDECVEACDAPREARPCRIVDVAEVDLPERRALLTPMEWTVLGLLVLGIVWAITGMSDAIVAASMLSPAVLRARTTFERTGDYEGAELYAEAYARTPHTDEFHSYGSDWYACIAVDGVFVDNPSDPDGDAEFPLPMAVAYSTVLRDLHGDDVPVCVHPYRREEA